MKLLPLFILLLPVRAVAQREPDSYYGPYLFKEGTIQTVFSDTAYVRSTASTGAAIVDTLFAFEAVRIVGTPGALFTVGRKEAPWYTVRYTKDGRKGSGALWGGTLAIHSGKRNDLSFACGVLSYPIPGVNLRDEGVDDLSYAATFSIKARTAAGIQECRYNISRESAYFAEEMDSNGKVTDTHIARPKGLPAGTLFYIRYCMSGEACGIPTYELQAAWDGQHLIRMPLLEHNADAGVCYATETFVFPAQKGGKEGRLQVKTVTESEDDKGKLKKSVEWRGYGYDGSARVFR